MCVDGAAENQQKYYANDYIYAVMAVSYSESLMMASGYEISSYVGG